MTRYFVKFKGAWVAVFGALATIVILSSAPDRAAAMQHPAADCSHVFKASGSKVRVALSPEEAKRSVTIFPEGPIDLTEYRAEEATLAAFRKIWPDFEQYKVHGFPNHYKKAFGRRANKIGITPEEMLILAKYKTGHDGNYDWVRALYSGDPSRIKEFQYQIKVLASALNKLPTYTGPAFRFVHLEPQQIARYKKGKIIFEPSFVSTSAVKRFDDYDFSNVRFEFRLKGKSGHNINFEETLEEEILLNANTPFRVIRVSKKKRAPSSPLQDSITYIVLEEIVDF